MKKKSLSKVQVCLSERDIRTIIRALDDYGAILFKYHCYTDASYADRLSRFLLSFLIG